MNQSDRKEFDLIHEKIDTIKNTINEIKIHNEAEHMKNRTDLKFIKDNMFDHIQDYGPKQNKIHNSDNQRQSGEVS